MSKPKNLRVKFSSLIAKLEPRKFLFDKLTIDNQAQMDYTFNEYVHNPIWNYLMVRLFRQILKEMNETHEFTQKNSK